MTVSGISSLVMNRIKMMINTSIIKYSGHGFGYARFLFATMVIVLAFLFYPALVA